MRSAITLHRRWPLFKNFRYNFLSSQVTVTDGQHHSDDYDDSDAKNIPFTADEFRNQHQIRLKSAPGSKEDYFPMMDFDSAPFSDVLKNILTSEKFLSPTPTQAQSWPIALERRDMISVARTGSGKTCAFLLPAFQQLLVTKEMEMIERNERSERSASEVDAVTDGKRQYSKHLQSPTVLILAPTRELAVQIYSEAQKFSSACELATTCLYGGVPKRDQILRLQAGVDMVIATPGRCIDLANGGNLDLSKVDYFVLDEADRMLDMGFEPQIRQIISKLSKNRQNLFFSATWPIEVQSLAEEFLSDPIQIEIGDSGVLNANKAIDQHVMVIKEHEKTDRLITLLEKLNKANSDKIIRPETESVFSNPDPISLPKTIIFVARRSDCDQLVKMLVRLGFPTDSLHGDRTQDMRDRAMDRFRAGTLRILVATDVASRGLDVKDIEVVVNYDFPLGASGVESYVHRIGRTARGHNRGSAYTFFTQRDGRSALELSQLLARCRQTTPTALKELARDVDTSTSSYSFADSRRGQGNLSSSPKISVPFRPVAHPAVKKALKGGTEMTCKGQNIGRRNNGQYESSSPASRGGGAGRALCERDSALKVVKKMKITEDYGDY